MNTTVMKTRRCGRASLAINRMPEIDVDLFTTLGAIGSAGSVCLAILVSILVKEKHHMKDVK